MGLISSLFGNASEVDAEKLEERLQAVLFEGERIDRAFRLVRDLIVFTDARLILVDHQGITGRKAEYGSVFYRSITRFSVETAGHFNGDCDLKIWISGEAEPLRRELKRGIDVVSLQRSLAEACAGR